jgi:hypothetical protein
VGHSFVHSIKRWRPSFWSTTIIVLALLELFLGITLFDARERHSDNVAAGCRGDDCFDTGFDVVFWFFWLFAWPLLCPTLALLLGYAWRATHRRGSAQE